MTYPVCPHCRQRIINPGGHAEACTGPGPTRKEAMPVPYPTINERPRGRERALQTELAPDHEIDPSTQVTRTPGVDAVCQKVGAGGYAPDCGFPFCTCYSTGGS